MEVTKQDVINHFKDAKVIRCLDDKMQYPINLNTVHLYINDYWGRAEDCIDYLLYDKCTNKFAEIVEYKEKEVVEQVDTKGDLRSSFKSSIDFTPENEAYIRVMKINSKEKDDINNINVDFEEVKASDKEEASDNGLRYNTGKLKWSLADFDSLEDMIKVLEFGANKYSADNWKKGLDTKEITNSLMRHLFAYIRGENTDPESGLPHTGHIMCNAMFLSYMHKFSPNFDSRKIDKNKEQN